MGSAEMRLLVSKNKYLSSDFIKKNNINISLESDKYISKYYNIFIYEGQCNYFNLYIRTTKTYFKDSYKVKDYILGYDDSYDRVSEYYIIYLYNEKYKKQTYNFMILIDLLYNIHMRITKLSNTNLVLCPMIKWFKILNDEKKNKYKKDTVNEIIDKKKLKYLYDERNKRIYDIVKIICDSYSYQVEHIVYNLNDQIHVLNGKFIKFNNVIIMQIINNKIIFNKKEYEKYNTKN